MRRFGFVPYSVMATRFDGVDESVDIGDVAELNFDGTDPFSISIWFKTDSSAANLYLFSKKIHNGGQMPGYALCLRNSSRFEMLLHNDIGSNEITVEWIHGAMQFRDCEWHHLVMTYDGSTNASGDLLYADGVLQVATIDADTLTLTIANAASASIASRNNANRFFTGDIDEATVWDKVLSTGEIAELFDDNGPVELINHSAIANLIGWWRLGDADAFPVIADLSASGNDGAMLNMEGPDFVSAEHPP